MTIFCGSIDQHKMCNDSIEEMRNREKELVADQQTSLAKLDTMEEENIFLRKSLESMGKEIETTKKERGVMLSYIEELSAKVDRTIFRLDFDGIMPRLLLLSLSLSLWLKPQHEHHFSASIWKHPLIV